jgi:hypothetical protein
MFRLLGLHRGPGISVAAASSLAAMPEGAICRETAVRRSSTPAWP